MKRLVLPIVFLIALAAGGLFFRGWFTAEAPGEGDAVVPGVTFDDGITAPRGVIQPLEMVAENLQIPWEVAFLPASPEGGLSGDMLITERPGTLKRIGNDGRTYTIEGVEHVGEGGLLGMALHPNFAEKFWIYLYLTTETNTGLVNRVERYRYDTDRLSQKTIIIDGIPGARFHDGGRIAFGPDGYLYITTGDAGNSDVAQDTSSLAGKILRVQDDGAVPADNPFGNAVYSYGHRNAQGLAWDRNGNLWATEHGRSGVLSGLDEINRIEKGANYGWPVIQGSEQREGMRSPVAHSGADVTWAPAGAAFIGNSLFFSGLRGEALYEARVQEDGTMLIVAHFQNEFGRIRAVVAGPDGFLYITTSNTDGRGNPFPGDDKIIRIDPRMLL